MRKAVLLTSFFFIACGKPTADLCYSPKQNLATAYESGSEGCPCDPAREQATCATYDEAGRPHQVALLCVNGRWAAVNDGPCEL